MDAEEILKKIKELLEKEGLNCSMTCYDLNKLQYKPSFYILDTIEKGTYKKFSITIENLTIDSNGNNLLK